MLNIEGRDVHNTFWHDVKTIWVSGNIRFEDIRGLQAPVIVFYKKHRIYKAQDCRRISNISLY